jgi:TPR repeat protein
MKKKDELEEKKNEEKKKEELEEKKKKEEQWFLILQEGKQLLLHLDSDERTRAFGLFESAAALGSGEALGWVAKCLLLGGKISGVDRNFEKAFEVAQRGVFLRPPVPLCLAVLGEMYLKGWGVAKDIDCGLATLQQAADLDDAYALYVLANYYDDTVKDKPRAYQLYERAIELGEVKAMSNYGVCLRNEIKPPQLERGLELYERAAALGYPQGMFNLAGALKAQNPTQVDRARLLLMQASALGHSEADERLKKAPYV